MSDTSRRKFLAAAGAGAAAGTVALASGGSASAASARPSEASAKERVVDVITDHRSSELSLLVGDREVVIRDRDLVTRILNAAGGK